MVNFTHLEQGTPASAWQLDGLTSLDELTETRAVIVAAHPDDETLGAGGLIAHLAARGVVIDVVVATAGEASHPKSTTLTPTELGQRRATEVRAAVHALAPTARLHLLGLPDGHLADHVHTLEAALIGLVEPGCLVVAPWRGDAHPDHEAAGHAAAAVAQQARLLEYPIWAWHWGSPGDPRLPWSQLRSWPVPAAALQRKAVAMAAHQTQVLPLSPLPGDETLLDPAFLAHFERDVEVFVEQPDPLSMTGGDFDRFYATAGSDPWGFTDRWYEERKRAITLASLPRQRFARGFEPGCSIGVLTELLAVRCDDLLATDVSEAALGQARRRTQRFGHVRIEKASVPGQWPHGSFDLVVLSEVGYYCGPVDLERLAQRAARSLTAGGVLVACHWRHRVEAYPLTGDQVHERLRAQPHLAVLAQHIEEDFVLDVLVPRPAASVARATGLLS